MRRLIAVAEKLTGRFRTLPVARSVWWPTFLRVAWSTGLRLAVGLIVLTTKRDA